MFIENTEISPEDNFANGFKSYEYYIILCNSNNAIKATNTCNACR